MNPINTAISPRQPGATTQLSELYTTATRSAVSRNPASKQLDTQIQHDQTRLSTLGRVASMLDGLHGVTAAMLASGMKFDASVSGKSLTASVSAGPPAPGRHEVDVKQLAQSQHLVAKPVADAKAAIGSGGASLIKVELASPGGAPTSKIIKLEAGSETLEGLASAFKAADVDATIVAGKDGFQLHLCGATGAGHSMRITVAGDATLRNLVSWPAAEGAGLNQASAAQDATLTVDGKPLTSASNKVEGAIAGIALNLATTGKSQVTVATDLDSLVRNAKGFVTAVNQLGSQLACLNPGDPATSKVVGQVESQLAQVLGRIDASALEKIGLTNHNGSLVLDENKLGAAAASDPASVVAMFTATRSGVSSQLDARLAQQLGSGGVVGAAVVNVRQEIDALSGRKEALAGALARQAAMLARQYANVGAGWQTSPGETGRGRTMSLFDFI